LPVRHHHDPVPLLLAVIDAVPVALVMIDQTGAIVFVNSEAEKLFGYSREEFFSLGLESLLPERFRAHHADLRNVFVAGHESRTMGQGRDLFGRRKNGSEFPVEIGLNPLETDGGLYVLSAIRDITARKNMEIALRTSNEVLEQSNLNLQQFAYIASHDLQSPLRTIGSFVQLLQTRFEDTLDSQAKDWFDRTQSGVQKMRVLITDLLAYTKAESRALPHAPVDFGQVFNDAVEFLDASIHDSGAEVTCSDLPAIPGDRTQLLSLMQNLIGNAIKYSGDRSPRIHVAAVKNGGEWLFSVHDNGIGINSKHTEKIFDIFTRLHTAETYPGTGIGLALCKRIVERHRGKIWVESDPGKGSVFHFNLPSGTNLDS